MRGQNIVKICTIVGFFIGLALDAYNAFAPRIPGRPSSMFVPEFFVPQEPGFDPKAPRPQPSLGEKIKSFAVLAFFMGPFGALAGCGVGLLLDGATRNFRRKPAGTGEPTTPAPVPPKES